MDEFIFLIRSFITQESYDSLVMNCFRFLIDHGYNPNFTEDGLYLNGNLTVGDSIEHQILAATFKLCEEMTIKNENVYENEHNL